ncbi:MAG: LacI family DNA-binding transcriptional regulator, partial [Streptococcus sp.]|nr:LacI family DNA-binding transcriptional regulator [Streptococcus sp.]
MQSSLTEVARVAGVSASTVSRYVRGQLRVTPETEDKILHAMDKVGWERPCDSYTS